MKIFLEYGCPKGKWHCSAMATKTREGFWYNGQIQLHISLPKKNCIKEKYVNKICYDCPVNGEVIAGGITLWDSQKSWEPLGEYR